MKTRFLTTCLLAVGACALGQSATFNQKYGTEEDLRTLTYLNVVYTQSWVRSDTATFNRRLWAKSFIQQNSTDGRLYSKAEMLLRFAPPRFDKIEYFYADKVNVQFVTNNVALIFAETPFRFKGDAKTGMSQYNDVYVKREGNWVCVSANISNVGPSDTQQTFNSLPPVPSIISDVRGSVNDIEVLIRLNEKHAEAFGTTKGDLLEDILADDFVLLHSNGLLYHKTDVITALKNMAKNNAGQVVKYKVENVNIRFITADVAMVHAAVISELKDGKKSATQYNDLYVKRGEKWLCVSGNNTSIKG